MRVHVSYWQVRNSESVFIRPMEGEGSYPPQLVRRLYIQDHLEAKSEKAAGTDLIRFRGHVRGYNQL